jgi:ferric-dicitrate binding protein FerR (iron transport regulator)
MGSAAAVSGSPIDRAIAWSIALESGGASDEQHAACQSWRNAHPENEQAWQQVQAVEQAFSRIPIANEQLAYRVLQASAQKIAPRSQRHAIKALGLLVLIAVVAPFGLLTPWQQAEYRTAIGQRATFTLDDGTELQLNTNSAAGVEYSLLRRRIVLQRGEILIETGRDSEALFGRRGFWVTTPEAQLEAIGTRFNVRRLEGETRLAVVQGMVAVHAETTRDTVVRAGETIAVGANAGAAAISMPIADTTADPIAWADGALVAKQMRLDAFVAELSRYRSAPVDCDPSVAAMQVSGVFQLNGVDPVGRTLSVLTRSLPVRIDHNPDGSVALRKIN